MLIDGCDASFFALEVGRQQLDNYNQPQRPDEPLQKTDCLHQWPYLQGIHGVNIINIHIVATVCCVCIVKLGKLNISDH